MSGFPTVIYEKRDTIAYVTLNRPQFLNAYNIQMRDDLYQVLGGIRDDSEVRVAILKGTGEKAFCAGGRFERISHSTFPPFRRDRYAGSGMFGGFFWISLNPSLLRFMDMCWVQALKWPCFAI